MWPGADSAGGLSQNMIFMETFEGNFRNVGDEKAPYSVHIYSNGKTVRTLFETDEQHVFGMNLIAICAHACGVQVLCPEIMDTHFHVIVKGDPDNCEKLRMQLQRLLDRWLTISGRRMVAPEGIEVNSDPIDTINELRCKFMYVYRNAITAGFAKMPWEYRWGPGNIFFVNPIDWRPYRRIGDMSAAMILKIFHTKAVLPPEWLCNDSFMIMPFSYVDIGYVETLFVNPKCFIAYLFQRKNIESSIDREVARPEIDRFEGKELRAEAKELAQSMFGRKSVQDASFKERFDIAKRLWDTRRAYSLPLLSRVTYIDQAMLESVFKSK